MPVECSEKPASSAICPIKVETGRVLLLDQRKLPERIEHFDATALSDMCLAITDMVVRGAPAIGVAAALGLAAEGRRLASQAASYKDFVAGLKRAKDRLQATRPTAVNLRWATEEIFSLACSFAAGDVSAVADKLFARAQEMISEDIEINMAIGDHGAQLIGDDASLLTHCNAGALATCGWGTALGIIRTAHKRGARLKVFVSETRPRQQGARLTVWELLEDGITPTLITDSMSGYLMSRGQIDLVVVGADRIAANGDTANKIGTYTLAVLARAHRIPFYVVAPLSTIDPAARTGKQIPIEERSPDEVTTFGGAPICPAGTAALNPAFDVTPARLITAIITERGILTPPYRQSIRQAIEGRPAVSGGGTGIT